MVKESQVLLQPHVVIDLREDTGLVSLPPNGEESEFLPVICVITAAGCKVSFILMEMKEVTCRFCLSQKKQMLPVHQPQELLVEVKGEEQ